MLERSVSGRPPQPIALQSSWETTSWLDCWLDDGGGARRDESKKNELLRETSLVDRQRTYFGGQGKNEGRLSLGAFDESKGNSSSRLPMLRM